MQIPTLDDYDLAIQQKLKGLIVKNKEVPVYYMNPEHEFKIKEVPCIVFYRVGLVRDLSRWSNDKVIYDVITDTDNNPIEAKYKAHPEPYNIFYVVRYYYRYHRDGIILFNHIMTTFPRASYLDILDMQYDIYFDSFSNPSSGYKDFGIQDKKREFVEQITYRLEALLDLSQQEGQVKFVQDTPIINTQLK
ncbi:MAG: hypothetical protein H0Z24_05900 [Thermosipho sp. (in: Bacteria)]|nr:hypothetical protein [Thermosipho sp. (in: thermotogales)]